MEDFDDVIKENQDDWNQYLEEEMDVVSISNDQVGKINREATPPCLDDSLEVIAREHLDPISSEEPLASVKAKVSCAIRASEEYEADLLLLQSQAPPALPSSPVKKLTYEESDGPASAHKMTPAKVIKKDPKKVATKKIAKAKAEPKPKRAKKGKTLDVSPKKEPVMVKVATMLL